MASARTGEVPTHAGRFFTLTLLLSLITVLGYGAYMLWDVSHVD